MAAKQILSLVVVSTWVVNLLIDNQIKEPKAYCSDPKKLDFYFRVT